MVFVVVVFFCFGFGFLFRVDFMKILFCPLSVPLCWPSG